MASTIQVRVDDNLKIQSDNLFRELGTDTTTAIRMFLTNNGFPFEIKKVSKQECNPYTALSEEEILSKLAKARKQADAGQVKDADEMIANMRKKYGL